MREARSRCGPIAQPSPLPSPRAGRRKTPVSVPAMRGEGTQAGAPASEAEPGEADDEQCPSGRLGRGDRIGEIGGEQMRRRSRMHAIPEQILVLNGGQRRADCAAGTEEVSGPARGGHVGEAVVIRTGCRRTRTASNRPTPDRLRRRATPPQPRDRLASFSVLPLSRPDDAPVGVPLRAGVVIRAPPEAPRPQAASRGNCVWAM
jgi:hypothetical protein